MESAAAVQPARYSDRKTPEDMELESRRNSLMLSRTRVLHDLQTACNPRYRQQLEQALAFLDQQVAALGGPIGEG